MAQAVIEAILEAFSQHELSVSRKCQIPPDLVVKSQAVDITEVI
jgi:hypothetical protein